MCKKAKLRVYRCARLGGEAEARTGCSSFCTVLQLLHAGATIGQVLHLGATVLQRLHLGAAVSQRLHLGATVLQLLHYIAALAPGGNCFAAFVLSCSSCTWGQLSYSFCTVSQVLHLGATVL